MSSWTRKLPSLDLFKKKGVPRCSSYSSREEDLRRRFEADESIVIPQQQPRGKRNITIAESLDDDERDSCCTSDEEEDEEDVASVRSSEGSGSETLARNCREFSERRLFQATKMAKKWGIEPNAAAEDKLVRTNIIKGQTSPGSTCSSGYFSLSESLLHHSSAEEEEVENRDSLIRERLCSSSSSESAKDSPLSSSSSMQEKIDFLRTQLLGLVRQDDQLFRQLLSINDSIQELKGCSSRSCYNIPTAAAVGSDDRREYKGDNDEEEEDSGSSEEQEINDLLDEALEFDLDEEDEEEEEDVGGGGGMSFQRQRVSFPATGKNRIKNRSTPPVRRELRPNSNTLPASLVKLKKKQKLLLLQRENLPPPPLPPPRFVFREGDERLKKEEEVVVVVCKHMKQSSFDSGIMGAGDHSSSSSDSASEEANSVTSGES